MKWLKVILYTFCITVSILDISTRTTNSPLFPSLKHLGLISNAQAMVLGTIVVSPNRGYPDIRTCRVSSETIGTNGVSVTMNTGTMTLCDYQSNKYCDYIGCH